MSKRRKKNKRIRCIACSCMFEITEKNTYYLDGEKVFICTNCGEEITK